MSIIIHTSLGDLKCSLFYKETPITTKNFLALAGSSYYNNTIFHRNIKGFIIQGGDPTSTGKGGESIYGKAFEDEINPRLKHNKRGLISMANSGKDSNKSQFFITYDGNESLDGKFTLFGKVIEGNDVLDLMEKAEVDKKYKPINEILLLSITILFNPIALKSIGMDVE